MAMTAEVKDELSRLVVNSVSARRAEVASLLRFAGGLHIVAGRVVVEAEVDLGIIARRLRKDIYDLYGYNAVVHVLSASGIRKSTRYLVRVAKDGEALARQTGLLDMRGRPVRGLPAQVVARFAELTFAYIDELSAASVSGHSDELATAGRVRQRHLDLLGRQLLSGEDPDILRASAETAAWPAPETLTAVLVPAAQLSRIAAMLNPASLQLGESLPGLDPSESWSVTLVPDADGTRRPALLAALAGRTAIVGPSRPWMSVRSSYLRALRARRLGADVVDTDEHLVELVLGADEEAAEDLRRRALAPLADLGEGPAERLAETLRSWLLNQGRRDAVAAELFVHPQTVRYRMNQVRQLYGERLNDPGVVLELTVALGIPRAREA